jgi:hypothetical protein
MSVRTLPIEFADLEQFVPAWTIEDQNDRHRKRVRSSLDELRAFYDAIYPRMNDLMGYLNGIPLCDPDELPPEAKNLYLLALSFMMISLPIDLRWRTSDLPEALAPERVIFTPPDKAEHI